MLNVNACVNLRPNNFDPPCDFLSKVDTLQDSHSVFQPHSSSVRLPHPAAARLHLDTLWWTAGAETSERGIYCRAFRARSSRLPSLPQASRSYALPPPMPRLAHSRCQQSRALPPLTPTSRRWPVAAGPRQDKLTPQRRPLYASIQLPLLSFLTPTRTAATPTFHSLPP